MSEEHTMGPTGAVGAEYEAPGPWDGYAPMPPVKESGAYQAPPHAGEGSAARLYPALEALVEWGQDCKQAAHLTTGATRWEPGAYFVGIDPAYGADATAVVVCQVQTDGSLRPVREEIPVSEEMRNAGLTVWLSARDDFEHSDIDAIYRAMRKAETPDLLARWNKLVRDEYIDRIAELQTENAELADASDFDHGVTRRLGNIREWLYEIINVMDPGGDLYPLFQNNADETITWVDRDAILARAKEYRSLIIDGERARRDRDLLIQQLAARDARIDTLDSELARAMIAMADPDNKPKPAPEKKSIPAGALKPPGGDPRRVGG